MCNYIRGVKRAFTHSNIWTVSERGRKTDENTRLLNTYAQMCVFVRDVIATHTLTGPSR